MFFQGNNDLRSLLLAHLVTEGGSGVRLFTSYTRPILEMLDIDVTGLKDKDEKHQSLQTADGINLLDRNIPPQDRNTNIMMREFQQSLEQGMTPGFSGRDWWKVGSSTSNDAKSSTNNSNSMTASTSPLTTNESQTPSIGPTARNPWSKRSSKTPAYPKQIYTGTIESNFFQNPSSTYLVKTSSFLLT